LSLRLPVRKAFEDAVQAGGLDALAERFGIEIVFSGIAVPGHKTYMVLKGPDFAAARRLFVESGIVQTNTVQIHVTETFAEFAEDIKESNPLLSRLGVDRRGNNIAGCSACVSTHDRSTFAKGSLTTGRLKADAPRRRHDSRSVV
jgi:hydroxyacyl-ACP dehydratase HTD2-like protein with hotdog domain